MKLNELVKIESGINSVRVKNQNYTLYTIEDVNYDLGHGEDYQHDKASGKSITAKGDVVINTVSNLASVVHSRNAGKMLNQIFLRLKLPLSRRFPPFICPISFFVLIYTCNTAYNGKSPRNSDPLSDRGIPCTCTCIPRFCRACRDSNRPCGAALLLRF